MVFLTTSNSGGAGVLGGLLILTVVLALYLAPTIVGVLRHRANIGQVVVVNVFLGWTFLGWIVALVMSFGTTESQVGIRTS